MKKKILALIAAGIVAAGLGVGIPVLADPATTPQELTFEERMALEIAALQRAGLWNPAPAPAPNDHPNPIRYDAAKGNAEFEERAAKEMTGGKVFPNSFEQRAAQELAARAPK
jgi:hypothetical protein